jgi:hypothetical protein
MRRVGVDPLRIESGHPCRAPEELLQVIERDAQAVEAAVAVEDVLALGDGAQPTHEVLGAVLARLVLGEHDAVGLAGELPALAVADALTEEIERRPPVGRAAWLAALGGSACPAHHFGGLCLPAPACGADLPASGRVVRGPGCAPDTASGAHCWASPHAEHEVARQSRDAAREGRPRAGTRLWAS